MPSGFGPATPDRARACGSARSSRDVADLALLDPVVQLPPRLAVAAHQADADLEVLLRGLLAPVAIIFRVVGPSTEIGFSMKTLRPFAMA